MATETPETPVADAESFSDYVQTENAKERADPIEAVAPETVPSEAPPLGEAPVAPVSGESQGAPGPEAVEQPRAKDGTFKKVSNTGEWARNRTLTAKLRETEAALAQLRQQQAQPVVAAAPPAGPASSQPPAVQAPAWDDPRDPVPTLDRYLSDPDPYATLALEAAKWAVRDARRQDGYQQQLVAHAEARAEVEARITTFAESHPDYQEKVAAIDDVKFEPPVLQSIAEDDAGPDIVYYLASHADEARRIAALTPVAAVKEIGKLSLQVAAASNGSVAPGRPISRAKAPIKPVGHSPMTPAGSLDPDQTDFADWVRQQNAVDRQRKRDGL
jgi:hypothetical protein